MGNALTQALLRHCYSVVEIHCAGAFHAIFFVHFTSEGTPRTLEVIGATVAVDKY